MRLELVFALGFLSGLLWAHRQYVLLYIRSLFKNRSEEIIPLAFAPAMNPEAFPDPFVGDFEQKSPERHNSSFRGGVSKINSDQAEVTYSAVHAGEEHLGDVQDDRVFWRDRWS